MKYRYAFVYVFDPGGDCRYRVFQEIPQIPDEKVPEEGKFLLITIMSGYCSVNNLSFLSVLGVPCATLSDAILYSVTREEKSRFLI